MMSPITNLSCERTERALILAALEDPACVLPMIGRLTVDSFVFGPARQWWTRIEESVRAGNQIAWETAETRWGSDSTWDWLHGTRTILPAMTYPEDHAARLLDLQRRRTVLVALQQAVTAAADERADLDAALREIPFGGSSVDATGLIGSDTTEDAYQANGSTTATPDVSWGVRSIDKWVRLAAGKLVVVAGLTSHGKSILALQAALNCARSHGPALFFSSEMVRAELFDRALSATTDVPVNVLERARTANFRLDDDELGRVRDGFPLVSQIPLYVRSGAVDPATILAECTMRRMRGDPPRLVVVDYLQDMAMPKADTRQQAVGDYARSLKDLALEFSIPVICCSQFNREGSKGGPPTKSQLRDSGNIEQSADAILIVYRPKGDEAQVDIDLIVDKNRNGPVGELKGHAQYDVAKIISWDDIDPESYGF